jgi:alkaline phosphatase D
MKLHTLVLLSLAAAISASWSKNLNYRSPSEHHPFMGIAIHKVVRRNVLTARFDPAQLNFTHGVSSGDPYSDSVILVSAVHIWPERQANCPKWTRCSPVYDDDHSNSTL